MELGHQNENHFKTNEVTDSDWLLVESSQSHTTEKGSIMSVVVNEIQSNLLPVMILRQKPTRATKQQVEEKA